MFLIVAVLSYCPTYWRLATGYKKDIIACRFLLEAGHDVTNLQTCQSKFMFHMLQLSYSTQNFAPTCYPAPEGPPVRPPHLPLHSIRRRCLSHCPDSPVAQGQQLLGILHLPMHACELDPSAGDP